MTAMRALGVEQLTELNPRHVSTLPVTICWTSHNRLKVNTKALSHVLLGRALGALDRDALMAEHKSRL
jgi:hypothetical protein